MLSLDNLMEEHLWLSRPSVLVWIDVDSQQSFRCSIKRRVYRHISQQALQPGWKLFSSQMFHHCPSPNLHLVHPPILPLPHLRVEASKLPPVTVTTRCNLGHSWSAQNVEPSQISRSSWARWGLWPSAFCKAAMVSLMSRQVIEISGEKKKRIFCKRWATKSGTYWLIGDNLYPRT